ncbi:NADPH-dependent 2,4-dienoyl-CoA reductase/sulfur reductase-like enzyme [Spirochaeta isovalerica]|uniref:NADPH-dependent 2,4-dienoyl-CoA reductase/sulfur reductase-like enzyme n=1 Tax=Spirochaeta isovalerica TaxID=150 RepID=A0A841RDI5_9SPIO|nr:NADPH-dependent 2,4-dienoyl-CoA reductase/sulfur reductase-like enzyme [Spirochaeta isovalerica]
MNRVYDVIVIGAGPAGMAAALEVAERGDSVLIIEREDRPGGILNQCIHDGFGLVKFKEKLTGPEYADLYVGRVEKAGIEILTSTFLLELRKRKDLFLMKLVSSEKGVFPLEGKAVIVSTGCRERSDRQIFIHGDRPAGIFTAGQAQAFINRMGYMPGKRAVILGSGDIGLIMARRLTLEGALVEGVYEIQSKPSGLQRNISQCLNDFSIPLHLGRTVSRIFGKGRIEAVEVVYVDERMKPVTGTETIIPCDCLILSVGLIPEIDILKDLPVERDGSTGGIVTDEQMQSPHVPGLFSCGNAHHVYDLVDYVSDSGEVAGAAASQYVREATA